MSKLFIYSNIKLPKEIDVSPYPKAKNILVVSPHSDDISVSCGMTIAKLAKHNNITPVVFFTGYRGINTDKKKAIIIREKEMQKEAKLLKINKPVFLRLDSYDKKGYIEKDSKKVSNAIKKHKPDIIFLPKKDDVHPRHRLATQITLKTVNKNIDMFFYENPWSLFKPLEFNLVSIFSFYDLMKNIKTIRAHKSQVKRTNFDKIAKILASFRGSIVPEQRILGYGKRTSHMKHIYIETFKIHGNNHNK